MSSMMYDPATGLPRQPQRQTPYGVPQFASLAGTIGTATGATGTGGTGTGTGGTGTGGVPSWDQYLANDPYWKQINADISAQGISDLAAAQAATRRAIIQFGEAPSGLTGQAAEWIDPTTRQLAAQNTQAGLSSQARLAKFNADQVRAARNHLARIGMLRSGELGHQLRENQGQYERSQYDVREQLTNTLAQIQSAYAAGQRAAQNARAQALNDVANRHAAAPPAAPPAAAPPPPPAAAPPAAPAPGPETPLWQQRLIAGREQRLFNNPF